MGLPVQVLNYARIVRKQVANIARGLIRDVDDLRRAHRAYIGSLLRIDRGGGCYYADLLTHDLLMRKGHLNSFKLGIDVSHHPLIETLLFDLQLVRHDVGESQFDSPGMIGVKPHRSLPLLEYGYQGVRNHNAVLIRYSHRHRLAFRGCSRLSINCRRRRQAEEYQER